MLQRGRRSSNSLAQPNVDGKPARLSPPTSLTPKEREVFVDLVAAVDARHFRESDLPLLISYVQASVMAQAAARKGDTKTWERVTRVQAMLATKLRVSPQTRLDPRTVARRPVPIGRRPWQDADVGDDDHAENSH
jgi:hypothetical protein